MRRAQALGGSSPSSSASANFDGPANFRGAVFYCLFTPFPQYIRLLYPRLSILEATLRTALFLAELKRRKVFRVATVYGATTFVILQAADIVFPSIGLPQSAMTFVIAVACIGFVMAVILAWTFESTAEGLRRTTPPVPGELEALLAQPRRRRWGAVGAALLGVVLLIAGTAWTVGSNVRKTGYDSIAVLPFTNMSGDRENEYFGDGLAEELLNALAGIDGLKVAARTSAFAFKKSNLDVRAIADTLDVATVLEGSVRRSADRVRITAQLVDARTGYQLWAETYDRPLTDLFAVQDQIAKEIVGALAGKFAASSEDGLYRGGTNNLRAYDLYIAGRQKWATREVPLLREAIANFEAAIALDSSYALAWSGLADAIDALAWRVSSERSRVADAKYAAQRAVALDPDLAEAWASLGVLAWDFDRDARISELALRRAIKLRPSSAVPHYWLSDVLRYTGHVEDAVALSATAIKLDPLSSMAWNAHVETLYMLGRLQEARAAADHLRKHQWSSNYLRLVENARALGFTASETGEMARSWAVALGHSRPDEVELIGRAIVDAHLRPRARQLLRAMSRELHGRALSTLSLAIGDTESALEYIEQASAQYDPSLLGIGTLPVYDPLRRDPRFIRVVKQFGLPNGIN